MKQSFDNIDNGQSFYFGNTAEDYARYRDIYPESMYRKLLNSGIIQGDILDVGTGSGVLPRNLCHAGARFFATDISPEQIAQARSLSQAMNITYAASPAEQSPFGQQQFDLVTSCQCFWYFDVPKFAAELQRILKPGGRFCNIIMEWLPGESEILAGTEELVLKYNPAWSGNGYEVKPYEFPLWAQGTFELETLIEYKENLRFTTDSWCGRIRSCRGIGATLPPTTVAEFDRDLRKFLAPHATDGDFMLPHFIRIEILKRT